MLRYRDGKKRLAVLADLRAFGDVAQAVEIEVGATVDRDEASGPRSTTGAKCLEAGQRERARRLGDSPSVLEDVLDGGADRIGVDRNYVV